MNVHDNDTAAWRRAFTAPVERDLGECGGPTSEQIWAARHPELTGELPIEERRAIVDHVALCAQCAESWRLAGELAAELGADEDEEEHHFAARVLPFRRHGMGAGLRWVAAAAVLVLGVGYSYQSWREQPKVLVRGEGDAVVTSQLAEGQPLPRADFVLRWGAVEGATYTVEVTDEDLDLIDRAEALTEPRHKVAEAKLTGLPAGATVFWQVVVQRADGHKEPSGTFSVEIE